MSSDRAASQVILSISGVSKAYRIFDRPVDRLLQMLTGNRFGRFVEHQALSHIDFELRRGETLAIVGRNGSGKSTLLQIIAGTMEPSCGGVVINGRVAALLELGAGFNPEFSGVENARLCMQIYGMDEQQIESRLGDVLAFADIGEYANRPVSTYSSGMFMRLAFAVVAHVDADILIIDEALAVGDAFFVQKCMRFLAGFRAEGGSLLFVSHDMGAVKSLCDRAIWLDGGRVVIDADPDFVSKKYLESMYAGSVPDAFVLPEEDQIATTHRRLADDDAQFVPPGAISILPEHAPREDFGEGGARVTAVSVLSSEGDTCIDVRGGEVVTLRVDVEVGQSLQNLIVGFFVKDRRGQALFGDNTFMTHRDEMRGAEAGDRWSAEFEFTMPILPAGDYVVTVAVADGTQQDHRICHWVHDALVIASHSRSVPTGLVGIPMRAIRLGREAQPGLA
jgi:lipopolysaccharide transport system ATP-binding protein